MNVLLMHAASRLRDELVKTAAVSFVAASASAAGQFAVHWAVNKWQGEPDVASDEESNPEIEQTA